MRRISDTEVRRGLFFRSVFQSKNALFGLSDIDEVPDAVPEALAARLELCCRALAQGVAQDRAVVASAVQVCKLRFPFKNFEHLLGVVMPVRGAVNVAARANLRGKHPDERLRDEAPLVVTRFAPGIGEVDVHAIERIVRNHVAHDFNGVVTNDAHVLYAAFFEALGKCADARGEVFASEELRLPFDAELSDTSLSVILDADGAIALFGGDFTLTVTCEVEGRQASVSDAHAFSFAFPAPSVFDLSAEGGVLSWKTEGLPEGCTFAVIANGLIVAETSETSLSLGDIGTTLPEGTLIAVAAVKDGSFVAVSDTIAI